jgi:ribosomal protein S20
MTAALKVPWRVEELEKAELRNAAFRTQMETRMSAIEAAIDKQAMAASANQERIVEKLTEISGVLASVKVGSDDTTRRVMSIEEKVKNVQVVADDHEARIRESEQLYPRGKP